MVPNIGFSDSFWWQRHLCLEIAMINLDLSPQRQHKGRQPRHIYWEIFNFPSTLPILAGKNKKNGYTFITLPYSVLLSLPVVIKMVLWDEVVFCHRITKIDITSPAGMTYTSPQTVPTTPGNVSVTTTWIPRQNQVGIHIVCALAEDSLGYIIHI